MTSEILKLIETVSPDDTQALDVIDHLVWNLVKPKDAMEFDRQWHPYYTRDRNALKQIRPKGWYCNMQHFPDNLPCFNIEWHGLKPKSFNAYAATEELAELCAIIKALEFERTKEPV